MRGDQQNRPLSVSCQIGGALRELEPNISKNAVGALWAPTGAIVCPYELTIAAVGNAMDNGAELRLNSEVTACPRGSGLRRSGCPAPRR